MRLLILGLGTAGSRIADAIVRPSENSSRCSTVHAIAVDNDPAVLARLKHIDEEAKFYFPRDDLKAPELLTTNFTIDELHMKFKSYDIGQHDAILLCGGLGGGLINLVPHLVSIIRETMYEPVFGLFTLPTEMEGEKRLKAAIEDLHASRPGLDGMIIFDNQIWYDRAVKQIQAANQQKPTGIVEKIATSGTGPKISTDPYDLINWNIARRLRLLIHAGDIQGEVPETVLDTREILNTISCSGYITIGLSEEKLPDRSIKDIFVPKNESLVHRQQRAGRIVRLAEKAVFREISAYCELSSTEKALILLAGPEEELSMKGYMAIRKWIDESINGFELRSGDLPLSPRQSPHISVLIVLAGVTRVDRVADLERRFLKKERI